MDLRTRTSLFCGALALAIAVSMLLRGRWRRPQLLFAAFAADLGLWYLAQWLYHFLQIEAWEKLTGFLAIMLPTLALQLFHSIVPEPGRRSILLRLAGVSTGPLLLGLVLAPPRYAALRYIVFFYTFGLLAGGLWSLASRGERSLSRATQRRVRFLVVIGAGAAFFTVADFLWFIGAPLPPIGAVLSIVFLFVLSESMTRERLVDLYDILGQLLVSTALAFVLAGIFYVFVVLFGGFDTMYLGAILAAIVILVLLEPLHEKVEQYIHWGFFRERVDLERAAALVRSQLVHVLEVDVMARAVITALEGSRRATGAALYLRDPHGENFELVGSFGPAAPTRLDYATARPLFDHLTAKASVDLEQVAYEEGEHRKAGELEQAEAGQRLLSAARALGPFEQSVMLGVHGDRRELLGILLVTDDRVRDAFAPDEVAVLETVTAPMAVVVENSRQYRRMQERDRLAVLGQMAAGLAHEVKNPLGAIKGAAQLLDDPRGLDPGSREFVEIILEEVERLDRVVGSVLSYARPSKGHSGPVDVNAVVRRTLQVLATDSREVALHTDLAEGLPQARLDAEQLRQILLNLVKNAIQAMNGEGRVLVRTQQRRIRRPELEPGTFEEWIEVLVQDEGPGIAYGDQQNLFVPFFTTKQTGTGLGLAISQRMVQDMGGRIEVQSRPGSGATFTVVLPAGATALSRKSLPPPDLEPAGEVPPLAPDAAE